MKNLIKGLLVILVLSFTSTNAQADESYLGNMLHRLNVTTEQFYAVGGITRTAFSMPSNNIWWEDGFSHDEKLRKNGFVLGVGFDANKFLAFEVNYRNLGKGQIRNAFNLDDASYWAAASVGIFTEATGRDKTEWYVRGQSYDALLKYPMGAITPYARFGIFHYRVSSYTEAIKMDGSGGLWTETIHGKGVAPIMGFGVNYAIDKNQSISFDYVQFDSLYVENTASKAAHTFNILYRVNL